MCEGAQSFHAVFTCAIPLQCMCSALGAPSALSICGFFLWKLPYLDIISLAIYKSQTPSLALVCPVTN